MKGQSNGSLWGACLGVKALKSKTRFLITDTLHTRQNLTKGKPKKKHSKSISTWLLKHGCTTHVLASNMQRKVLHFHDGCLQMKCVQTFAFPVTFHSFPALTAASSPPPSPSIDSQSSCKALGEKSARRSLFHELHSSERVWEDICIETVLETHATIFPKSRPVTALQFTPSQFKMTQ